MGDITLVECRLVLPERKYGVLGSYSHRTEVSIVDPLNQGAEEGLVGHLSQLFQKLYGLGDLGELINKANFALNRLGNGNCSSPDEMGWWRSIMLIRPIIDGQPYRIGLVAYPHQSEKRGILEIAVLFPNLEKSGSTPTLVVAKGLPPPYHKVGVEAILTALTLAESYKPK